MKLPWEEQVDESAKAIQSINGQRRAIDAGPCSILAEIELKLTETIKKGFNPVMIILNGDAIYEYLRYVHPRDLPWPPGSSTHRLYGLPVWFIRDGEKGRIEIIENPKRP